MISRKRKNYIRSVRALMGIATALTAALTLFLVAYVLIRGLPHITWQLLSTKPSYLMYPEQ